MQYLVVGIVMILVPVFLSYLNMRANEKPIGNLDILKMPKAYLFMGYLMCLMGVGVLVVSIVISGSTEFLDLLFWSIIAVLFLFGLYIVELYLKHQIHTSEESFTVVSIFGKQKTFKYNEITSINLNLMTYFITIKDKQGQTSSVYFHLKNLIVILKKIQKESGRDITSIERVLKF